MKKTIIMALLLLATVVTYAIPNGCYSGRRPNRRVTNPCAISIYGNNFYVMNSEGKEVVVTWKIVSDNGETLTLRSEAGATAYAYYSEDEEGRTILSFNYMTYTFAD